MSVVPNPEPYRLWRSPIDPRALVAGAEAVGELRVDGAEIWWSESRPSDGGRIELVRCDSNQLVSEQLGNRGREDDQAPWSARSSVGEYGGGAWCVEAGVVTFANWADQRVYSYVADDPGASPIPISPMPLNARGVRFNDLVAFGKEWIIAVAEVHPGELDVSAGANEAELRLVALPTDGSAATDPTLIVDLHRGPDFVSSPAPGPAALAWVEWDHPNMPWNETRLMVARLRLDAERRPTIDKPRCIAGDSIVQPEWGPNGELWFASDASGWWNLYRVKDVSIGAVPRSAEVGSGSVVVDAGSAEVGSGSVVVDAAFGQIAIDSEQNRSPRSGFGVSPVGLDANLGVVGLDAEFSRDSNSKRDPDDLNQFEVEHIAETEAEIGGPRWVGGMRWFTILSDGRIVAASTADGETGLVLVDPDEAQLPPQPIPMLLGDSRISTVAQLAAGPGPAQVVVVGASAVEELTPVLVNLDPSVAAGRNSGGHDRRNVPIPAGRLRSSKRSVNLGQADISVPRHITFPSSGGRDAHGLLYLPTSATAEASAQSLPPLVVMIHGGPTSAARPMFDLRTQFWTSRGFAVIDVNYGGSTGYGRTYRQLLEGNWGVVDVEDCVSAAGYLAETGLVDGSRMVIRGGSAGGLTTLLALCQSDIFAAGTSLYGVTDLSALAGDTHKFESRYLDSLVGPWPEASEIYAQRSPVNLLDDLDTPLLVLQGADDAVVPASQAEAIVSALADRGVAHRYILFEGEGHGFRKAETLVAALKAELDFYTDVLALESR